MAVDIFSLDNQHVLLKSAQALGAVSYATLLDKHPSVKIIDPKKWLFVVSAASIFMINHEIENKNIPETEKKDVIDSIKRLALKLDADYVRACKDCESFIDQTIIALAKADQYQQEPQYLFSDCLGGWICWNLFGHSPSGEEEGKLVRVLGFLVMSEIVKSLNQMHTT